MLRFFLIILVALPLFASQDKWYILSHDDGCIDMSLLNRKGDFPHTPTSPQDYAKMMQEQGKSAIVKENPNKKIVQVKLGGTKTLFFVKEELCHNLGN
ncbi:hypothetical protein [Sulfurimonas sp.]|uniref:hypothetical protein n=1 Tax=Sulfurimonas sp. TaxID=2022749 RepID=UPI003D0D1414